MSYERERAITSMILITKIIIISWVILFIYIPNASAQNIKFIHNVDECVRIALDNALPIKKLKEDYNTAHYKYTKTLKELCSLKINLTLTPKSYKYYDEPIILQQEVEISEAEANKYKASESWYALLSTTKLLPTGGVFSVKGEVFKDILKGELKDTDASYEVFQKPKLSLNLNQPFFLFKKNPYQRGIREAWFTLKVAEEDFNSSKQELIYQVKKAYLSCLLADEKVKIQEESIKYTESLYNITQANFNAGKVPKIDLIQAEIQLEANKESLSSSIENFKMECIRLKSILGLDRETTIRITDELTYKEPQIDFDEILHSILTKSSKIKQLEEMINLTELELEKIKEKNKPDISLNIDYGHQYKKIEGTMDNTTLSNSKGSNQWEVALNFNWPLFDSGVVETELKEYRAKIEALKYNLLIEKGKITLCIQEIERKMTKIKGEITSLDKRIRYAESLLHIAELRYKEGIGTLAEIIHAQRLNSELKFKKKEAIFNLLLTITELERFKLQEEAGI